MATRKEMTKLVEKYCKIAGMSSREDKVRHEFIKDLKDYADDFKQDGLGSIAAYKKGTDKNGPVIMLAGHMDEIGLMVTRIDEKGFIYFNTVGGWWGHVMLGQIFDIHTRDGKVIKGIIGSTPPHILPAEARGKVVQPDAMFIDIGVKDKKEAEALGVNPGDQVVPHSDFFEMGNKDFWAGKAFDDRIGVTAAIEVIRSLKGKKHKATFVGVGTVQEERGLIGATTSAQMVKPDIAFAIDVTIAKDTPGLKNECALGKGVALSLMDSSTMANPRLVAYCEKIAKKHKIDFTYDTLTGGGTDSGQIQRQNGGIPSLTLSIPSRYIHSHWSMIHWNDYKTCVDLLIAIASEFTSDDLATILDTKWMKKK